MASQIPILFIAHHFPPMSGPGMFRSFHFVRHLPEQGYKAVVLTITEKDLKEMGTKTDRELMELLPADTEIIRIGNREPRKLKAFLMKLRINRLLWFFAFPFVWEPSALWPLAAYRPMASLIRERDIPLVYSSSGPFSPMLLAYLLKRKTGVKWVADIRDPYTDGYMWQWPGKLHWYFSRIVERFLLKRADKVIVNTPEVKKLYLKRRLLPESNIVVLTNGY